MYEVIDSRTGMVMGKYKSLRYSVRLYDDRAEFEARMRGVDPFARIV